MKRVKVRFNLSRGKNYLKWKVEFPNGKKEYFEPNDVTLYMENCYLHNNEKASTEIFKGQNKKVCAWILCDKITIYHKIQEDFLEGGELLSYNPRKSPFWVFRGKNFDKQNIGNLITINKILKTIK